MSKAIKKQVKFAVVMYGGGSLAIYINGVAQELFKMVQATGERPGAGLSGTALVYRKIAHVVAGEDGKARRIGELQAAGDAAGLAKYLDDNRPNVRFVIDIITGTSAGGINGVFLAKALARGVPDIAGLQDLWLKEGDFDILFNDRRSVKDNLLDVPVEPESLLNGDRMYLKLLEAFETMDPPIGEKSWVGNGEQLDLYVTYTDFSGIPTGLRLSDGVVQEKVHKRFFRLRYHAQQHSRDDLGAETSSSRSPRAAPRRSRSRSSRSTSSG